MKNNHIVITIIVALVVGAAAFYGGMQYQKSQRGNVTFGTAGQGRQFGGQFGSRNGGGAGGAGFRPVVGEIISSDATSMTVKSPDGSSKIVLLSSKTTINKSAAGSVSDLKTGEQVAAFGTQNSDGSLTAQSVQLNPQMRLMQRPTGQPTQ